MSPIQFALISQRMQGAALKSLVFISGLLTACAFALGPANMEAGARSRIAAAQTLPIVFEPNVGQVEVPFGFIAHQNGLAVGFSPSQVEFSLSNSSGKPSVLLLSFEGANSHRVPVAEGLLSGHVNYLRGNTASLWKRDVPTYARLRYHNLYPGVDLVFYGNGRQMEHDFIVSPSTDPRSILMSSNGAHATRLSPSGELVFEYADGGQIVFRKPIAYQQTEYGKTEVAAAYRKVGQHIGFSVGTYDRSLALTIDPVLDYSTYLADDHAQSIAVAADSQGNTYVTGFIFDPTYPVTAGAVQGKCSSCPNKPDIFVTKLKADGSGQVYSTFIGGSDYDQANRLAVDDSGNAIVVGYTSSQDFPQKNSINSTANGYAMQWGFIASLSAAGSSLNYSSVLGQVATADTSASTSVAAVSLDSSGNAYITGMTDAPLFPTTPGALKAVTPTYPNSAVFVSKVLTDGTLGYSAIIGDASPTNGGGGPIGPAAIAVDGSGSAYVYGKAGTNWPITSGAYQPTIGGTAPYAAPYVTKIATEGSSLTYSTFVGSGYSIGGIAVNSAGDAILTGSGPDKTYPTTSDALFPTYPSISGFGPTVSWLTLLNSSGTGLVYSSYLTGGDANSSSLALDSSGDIWVAGVTADPKFPLVHPVQGLPGATAANGGIKTGFILELAPAAKNILFSTYIGGPAASASVVGIALDSAGKPHVTGAGQPGMYTTPGAFQGTVTPPPPNVYPAWSFAAKLDTSVAAPSLCINYPDNAGIGFFETTVGTSSSHSLTLVNCGTQPLTVGAISTSNSLFSIPANQNQCGAAIAPSGTCSLTVQFTPTSAGTTNAKLQIDSNASIPTSVLPLSGTGAVSTISVFAQNGGNFYPLLVGQTSAAQIVSVSNTGMSPLQINLAASSITGDFSYTTSASCNSPIFLGSSSCVFFVAFSPTAAGARSGTLTIASNDPASPIVTVALSGTGYAAYPVPTISQLDPPTFPIGSAAFTANVYGGPFFPTSVVKVSGHSQTTTYSNSTSVRVTVDPGLRSSLGELNVTVANPAPGGGESAAVTATLYQALSLDPSSIVYVPATNLLYAAVGSGASSNANTVVPIDPSTGTTKSPIVVGKDPRMLVASEDGKYLYVALQSDQTIQRIDLASSTIDRTFPFPPNQVEVGGTTVTDMHVIPGTSDALVIAVGGEVALYRDTGFVNAVPTAYPPLTVSSLAFTDDPSTAYALPFTDLQNHYFNIFTFDSAGIHFTPVTGTNFGPYDQTGAQVVSDGTLLYTSAGQVWNPATASLSGTFPVNTYNSTSYPNDFTLALDRANRRIYVIGDQNYGTASSALTISAYDKSSLHSTGTLAFPAVLDPTPTNLVRWGNDGLAFIGWDQGNPNSTDVYLIRSRLVFQAPAPAVTISALSLTFDKQDAGTSSASQTITLTNTGSAALVISGAATTAPFSVVSNCGNTLAVGASCSMSVTFSPTIAGAVNGMLTISDNSASGSQVVSLLGTGTSPDFALASASGGSTAATVAAGQAASYSLLVAGSPGFSGQVNLTCTGAPANASCSIAPSSVTLAKGANASFIVTVTTQATITASLSHYGNWTAALAVLAFLGMPLMIIIGKPTPQHATLSAIVLISLAALTSAGCGGGSGQNTAPPGPTTHVATTPQGTYTLMVTATSGSATTSQPLTLKVQ